MSPEPAYARIANADPVTGELEETRRVAENHMIRLRGVLGELAIAQGWSTKQELDQWPKP